MDSAFSLGGRLHRKQDMSTRTGLKSSYAAKAKLKGNLLRLEFSQGLGTEYAVEIPLSLMPKMPADRHQWIVNLLQAYHSLDTPFDPNRYDTYATANRWADAGVRALQGLSRDQGGATQP